MKGKKIKERKNKSTGDTNQEGRKHLERDKNHGDKSSQWLQIALICSKVN